MSHRLVLLTALIAVSAARAQSHAGYDAARTEAARAGRPVLILAASPAECEKSRELLDVRLVDPAMKAWVGATVIPVTLDPFLDAPEGDRFPASPALVEKLALEHLPALVLVEGDGDELGRLAYEGQSPAELIASLGSLISMRRGWRSRLARMEVGDDASLGEAAHLFRHCFPLLGKSRGPVAGVIFTRDEKDSHGLRDDAALVVALSRGPHAGDALAHLKSIAPTDPKKRYAFVLFQKTDLTLQRLVTLNEGLRPVTTAPGPLRELALQLVEEIRLAREVAPCPEVEAQLLGRAALAHHILGREDRARDLMRKARALAGETEVP